ncbi:dienelactone hydrolase [Pedobacter lusitanus]|uniref:Dienelactone hydrolase n=1 Tax=Pedobacter lusitanus TaxID=1503925 RepID=A0A0D0GRM5_9SPHI|nr:alpha/beta fold hydrolase [Pedobacter lusitanus]KIO77171.1 dienelactone hydrolase [Pedobacter lusitanus]
MKKITLLLFVLLCSNFCFSQDIIKLFNRSSDFFDLLDQKKFTEAQAYFDASVSSKISAGDLQKMWENFNDKLGKFESASGVESKTKGDFFVVTVDGKFAKTTQSFLLAYNKAGNMVGFFVAPNKSASAYQNPVYADTTLYTEKEVYIKTQGHSLVGKLTIPKNVKNFPVVVLVHGSGPADMDETVGPNKTFKDLAAGFAAKGVASIRYVKRTMVYSGEFGGAFTVKEEVTDDALAAIALAGTIPDADKKQIYLMGHSLGGMLAPRIAALAPELNGMILAAAPARTLTDILIEQNKYMFDLAKDTTQSIKSQFDARIKELDRSKLTAAGNMKPDSVILGLPVSYWVDLNKYNQVEVAKKNSKQRMLIIQGGNDFQVSTHDYELWSAALNKKRNVTLKLYPDLNHLLSSQVEKGPVSQYDVPSNVSETLINDLVAWIKSKS